MNTIELDKMKVGPLHSELCLRNKPHFRFEESFIPSIKHSMQAFSTTEPKTRQNLIAEFNIYWLENYMGVN